MSLTRTLMLLAGTALAAMAFSATPAAAQEGSIEVVEEGGNACNPCTIHATGESHIRNLFSGSIISSCNDDFEGTINHDGTGELRWTGTDHPPINDCAANCDVEPGDDETHWPISGAGETGTDTGHMTVRFCVDPTGLIGDSHCNAEVQVQETTPHHHVFSTEQICSGGASRAEGSWEQETTNHDEVEVVHL